MERKARTPELKALDVTGVIFCGGMSRRMGQDKALLEVEGQTLLQKANVLLEPHVSRVVLSTGPTPRYEKMGLPCVLDPEADMGPIGGLFAALTACETPWILALACDLPRLSEEAVLELLGARREGDKAVLFGSPQDPEPLFALYHHGLLPIVDAAIRSGHRRMTSALGATDRSSDQAMNHAVRWLPITDDNKGPFSNVNRPEDWREYQHGCKAATSDGEEHR
ncbi:MAG: molybdenum cofactor guanylyltransferase [bacterium]|nr:molybdenum cofactor guanylyltransferase [bacterium]